MGSFEVRCKGITLFSKLELGYFPHTTLLTARIVTFIKDAKEGKELDKYKHSYSPIKHHPVFNKSPSKSPQRTKIPVSNIYYPDTKESHHQTASQLIQPQESKS